MARKRRNNFLSEIGPKKVKDAFEMIKIRRESGDNSILFEEPIVNSEVLSCFNGEIPFEALNVFLNILFGEWSQSAYELREATDELAIVILSHASLSNQFDLAMQLKIRKNRLALVKSTIESLNHKIHLALPARIPIISHFFSCLLDGEKEVRNLVIDSIKKSKKIIQLKPLMKEISYDLSDVELKLLEKIDQIQHISFKRRLLYLFPRPRKPILFYF